MAKPQIAQARNATAARKMQRMYTKQCGHKCEDCGEDSFARRTDPTKPLQAHPSFKKRATWHTWVWMG